MYDLGKTVYLHSTWATPAPYMAPEEIQNLNILGQATFLDPSEVWNVLD